MARALYIGRKQCKRRVRARGVTLIEVMIVVMILGVIASGVAVAVFPKLKESNIKNTKISARTLRTAAEMWRSDHGDDCPTLQQLKIDHAIDSASNTSDAWNVPFKIVCDAEETIVTSAGPDKKEGTADDIRIPEAQQQQ